MFAAVLRSSYTLILHQLGNFQAFSMFSFEMKVCLLSLLATAEQLNEFSDIWS